MAEVSSLLVRVGADTSDLMRGLQQTESRLGKLGNVGLNVGIRLAQAFAVATAAITAMTLKGIQLGDESIPPAVVGGVERVVGGGEIGRTGASRHVGVTSRVRGHASAGIRVSASKKRRVRRGPSQRRSASR